MDCLVYITYNIIWGGGLVFSVFFCVEVLESKVLGRSDVDVWC